MSCPTKRYGGGPQILRGLCETVAQKEAVAKGYLASGRGRDFHRRPQVWLWRAVDEDGYVLDEVVQERRDTKAAKRLLVRLLKKQGLAPKRIVTDKQRSYGATRRDVMSAVEQPIAQGAEQSRGEFSRATSKTRTDDAGISIFRRPATFHLSLFSSPKSLRPAAPETLSPRHPHSSDPRDGAVECRGRRNSLRSQTKALSGR